MLKVIKKYKYLLTMVIVLLIIILCVVRNSKLKESNKVFFVEESSVLVKKEDNTSETEEVIIDKVKVDIKGQVVNPGVYELDKDSRVIDAINIAGGLTDVANTSLINLAKKIDDSMVIIIYSDEEVKNSNVKKIETVFKVIEKECNCPVIENDGCINTEITGDDYSSENNLVNINTASKEELMSVSGIGESKADSIIEYRNKTKFNSVEDIMNVSGIGESLFEKIKMYITV